MGETTAESANGPGGTASGENPAAAAPLPGLQELASTLPFPCEIVFMRGIPTRRQMERFADGDRLSLRGGLSGPAILRAGGRDLAIGVVEPCGQGWAFRLERLVPMDAPANETAEILRGFDPFHGEAEAAPIA